MTTFTWTTDGSADWNIGSHWSPASVPTSSDSAVIAATGTPYTVTIGGGESVDITTVKITSPNATLEVDGTLAASSSLVLATGSLSILNGGTADGAGLGIATSAVGTAKVTVSGTNSLFSDSLGANVGAAGTGMLDVLNGGTIMLTGTTGITVGLSSTAIGTLEVSGVGSQLDFGSTAKGFTIGDAGQGTIEVLSGGTISMNGTGGILMGASAAASGFLEVSGSASLLNQGLNGNGIGIGRAATASGTLEVLNGGTVSLNGTASTSGIGVGQSSGATGIVHVDGAQSLLELGAANGGGFFVGTAGTGEVDVTGGASIEVASPTNGNINLGGNASGALGGIATVTVSGGSTIDLGDNLFIWAGSTVSVDSTSAFGVSNVASLAAGELFIGAAGTVEGDGFINAAVLNTGIVISTNSGTVSSSNGGTLEIAGGVGGAGTLELAPGATLRLDSQPANTVHVAFDSGATAETLIVGTPTIDSTGTGPGNFASVASVAVGDRIELGAGTTIDGVSLVSSGGTTDAHIAVTAGATIGTYVLSDVTFAGGAFDFTTGHDGATGNDFIQAICFLRGTRIATPAGEKPVEELATGDAVLTHDGNVAPIIWIGVGRVLVTPGKRSAATPVIVRKGALAPNVPHRDPRVTKGHSLYLDGVLVPVEYLVNHRSIIWDDRAREIEIFHVELPDHAVLLADGAPAESYRDDGNRWLFQNANRGWNLPPVRPFAPLLTGGPIVDAIWRRLLERDGVRVGLPLTDDPDLHLIVDGKRIDAIAKGEDNHHVFRLAVVPREVRISSRASIPLELGTVRDDRSLGVAIRQIVVAQGARRRAISAGSDILMDGYHAFEPENGIRWTNGSADVPMHLFRGMSPGPCMLLLYTGGNSRYLDDAGSRAA